jgi:hypothetical protein
MISTAALQEICYMHLRTIKKCPMARCRRHTACCINMAAVSLRFQPGSYRHLERAMSWFGSELSLMHQPLPTSRNMCKQSLHHLHATAPVPYWQCVSRTCHKAGSSHLQPIEAACQNVIREQRLCLLSSGLAQKPLSSCLSFAFVFHLLLVSFAWQPPCSASHHGQPDSPPARFTGRCPRA